MVVDLLAPVVRVEHDHPSFVTSDMMLAVT
jgi:hypothetical protein